MDSDLVIAIVGGCFTIVGTLVFGLGVIYKQFDKYREESMKFQADVTLKLERMEGNLSKDFMLRAPHIEVHRAVDKRFEHAEERIRRLEGDMKFVKGKA